MRRLHRLAFAFTCLLILLFVRSAVAADKSFGQQAQAVLLLRDYNTRVVLFGTTLLGISGGVVGVFMLLRKQSLVGDVVGHSALPGLVIAFILVEALHSGHGKSLPVLLIGALLAGGLGAVSVLTIDRFSRIKPDAAMAIVLSIFYGAGTVLLSGVQQIPTASASGLKDFLVGKTALLVANDVWLFAYATLIVIAITALMFKELCLVCFDDDFAAVLGWNVFWLDTLLTGLVVAVTILGMQSVGLLLVVAILIIPAASARFWSDDIRAMTWIAALLGGSGAAVGTIVSALFAKVAAGAVIVLSGSAFFLFSMLFGSRRGVLWRWLQQRALRLRIGERDLLRAIYEKLESSRPDAELPDEFLIQEQLSLEQVQSMRSWSLSHVLELARRAERDGLVTIQKSDQLRLTPEGAVLARRATRDHRLWEQYLIQYAEIAPSHVDRDADQIEHVLGPEIIRELERRMVQRGEARMPASPHQIHSAE